MHAGYGSIALVASLVVFEVFFVQGIIYMYRLVTSTSSLCIGGGTETILGGLSINIAYGVSVEQILTTVIKPIHPLLGGGGALAPKPYGFCRLCYITATRS